MAGDVQKEIYFLDQDRPTVTTYDEKTRKFITSKTVNIHEQLSANKLFSPVLIQSASSCASSLEQTTHTSNYHQNQLNSIDDDDISEELRSLTEQLLPDLCTLDGEQFRLTNGTKFYCTIKDILTSDGEFWVERELSIENERKFRQFIDILSLVAISYESLKRVYVGQLVALYYETSWHRALVVSKSEGPTISTPPSARVRLVDYGSSLYVNVSQLKWLPEQFYLFPFKAVECVFSEAIKPTFSDTIRLTFKQLVLNKRLYATIYDRDGTRICILLKCKTDEGIINVYRYLRAHEHKSKHGRMLADGEIIACLRTTIRNNNSYLDQSTISILTPPSSIKLTRNQLQIRRAEINEICKKSYNENDMNQIEAMNGIRTDKKSYISSAQSTPFSASTIITPMPRLTFDL